MKIFAIAALLCLGLAACGQTDASAVNRTPKVVRLTAFHSHWSLAHLDVARGMTVRFVVRNTDPIDHELIVGDAGVQERHEKGTEAKHGLRPGEITVPAGTTAVTELTFDRAGPFFFGCHLPGHWAYGMHGSITVTVT